MQERDSIRGADGRRSWAREGRKGAERKKSGRNAMTVLWRKKGRGEGGGSDAHGA